MAPRSEAAAPAFVARPAPADTRPRVLLAEDDRISANVVRHRLERDGMAVTTVSDGKATLDALSDERLDAALLSASLPGVDGLEVLRRVRAGETDRPELGVGVILWPGNDRLVARAYDLDADDVIVRPFSLIAVSAGVRRLTRRRSL
ncbi:hypothetical protein BSZ37_11995 [Rubrivirga marina]|uniref:Response regulatory domain-containing protein n=1 Tax=Rubrivirga marina TaxID=1196024 RepID=A0A271J0S0_9BACT|nr:hypothetical protein BSZ37_11995 [Rubrivirga marina]